MWHLKAIFLKIMKSFALCSSSFMKNIRIWLSLIELSIITTYNLFSVKYSWGKDFSSDISSHDRVSPVVSNNSVASVSASVDFKFWSELSSGWFWLLVSFVISVSDLLDSSSQATACRVVGKIEPQWNGWDPTNLGGSKGGYLYWSLMIWGT